MRSVLAVGVFGGAAVVLAVVIVSAGIVPALLFGILAGVPALVLISVATYQEPLPRLAPFRTQTPCRLPPAGTAYDDETGEWVVPQPRRQPAACCSPLRYDPLTMIRENSFTYDLTRVTASEPDELDEIDDLDVPDDWGDEPEELPLAVSDWPRLKPVEQPAVVEPAVVEPVPVIVNRMAARFAALEIER